MHGKKGGKSPKVPKKSPAKGKRKLTRLSASNSSEEIPPVVEDAGTSTEEDMSAYLDPVGSDTNVGKDIDGPPAENSSDESSEENTVKDVSTGSILRKVLESPIGSKVLINEPSVVVNPPRGNVIVPSPTLSNPSPMKSPSSTGVIRKLLQAESPCPVNLQPLGIEPLASEEAEAVPDIAGPTASLVSPSQRPRISPKKRQSPAAADPNIGDPGRSPPTPSKIAKTTHFQKFGVMDSPTADTDYIMVTTFQQNEPPLGQAASVVFPTTGSETRNVTFYKPPASRTSSADTDETARPMDHHSEAPTPKQVSKLYIRAITEDRFTHMAINVAEKFRLIPETQQQFIAESLQHIILEEALAGRLTRQHKLIASQCAHCATEMKDERPN